MFEDYIRMVRANQPDSGEGQQLSRDEFLEQNPGSWIEMIKGGNARYVRADGITLKKDEALRTLKVFIMCRNVKRRVAERLAANENELTKQHRRSA